MRISLGVLSQTGPQQEIDNWVPPPLPPHKGGRMPLPAWFPKEISNKWRLQAIFPHYPFCAERREVPLRHGGSYSRDKKYTL